MGPRSTFFLCLALAASGCSAPPPASPSPARAPVIIDTTSETSDAGGASLVIAEVDAGASVPSDDEGTPGERALREWTGRGQGQCSAYDYFPRGGIQNFWCHRPLRLTVAAVHALAGGKLFVSGPHRADALVLDASDEFGHYDPAFVRWLVEAAGPSARGSAARVATQAAYDARLRPLAEIFWATLTKIRREPACFVKEKNAYADAVVQKRLPKRYYERWFHFMNPDFCAKPVAGGGDGGVDGNVTKTVVGFWIRRSIDRTMDAFAEGLTKLIAAYDPELLQSPDGRRIPSSRRRAGDPAGY